MSASVVLRRRLANQLREVREAAGLTQEQVAKRGGIALRTIGRAETGENTLGDRDLKKWLTACEADPDTRERLVELGQQARKRGGWWSAYRDVLPGPYVQLEAEAAEVRNYESFLVPGLLQTEGYARTALDAVAGVKPHRDVDRHIELRARRQQRLWDEDPLVLQTVIDESVIQRLGGGREVMLDQLAFLVEACELPNVSLRIIPLSAGIYAGTGRSFAILKFPHPADPDIVMAEALGGERYFDQAEEIAMYNAVFDDMSERALREEDSVQRIEEVMAKLSS